MVAIDAQLHGYRQGHQLIASSVALPKADQSVIDRLSDVAGPLRPKERFEPYISGYPLPSGSHYVLARTWQDDSVSRAGCVRTLSLLIPTTAWSHARGLGYFLHILELDNLPTESNVARHALVPSDIAVRLPPAPEFRASELLEALFLEEPKPVAIFDAPAPELIAIRLLTALWPTIKRRFAISTFALAPRKIAGRDFDLVFAPKSARSKFADWSGRRVDGQAAQGARHRWTDAIVNRVFDEPFPRLLTDREIELVGDADTDGTAVLRIALLWDELLEKLGRTPSAALGLLDIANSGMVENSEAIAALEPALAKAIRHALTILPVPETWEFLGAIARKMQGRKMPRGNQAIVDVAAELASQSPHGAIQALNQPDPRGVLGNLLPSIAKGLAVSVDSRTESALFEAPSDVLAILLAESGPLAKRAAGDRQLIERLAEVLPSLEPALFDGVARNLLPELDQDWQFPAARPLLDSLDETGIADEVRHLGQVNDFAAESFTGYLVKRARNIDAIGGLRSALLDQPPSERRDKFLAETLDATFHDVRWLLAEQRLDYELASVLVANLLRGADTYRLCEMLSEGEVGGDLLSRLPRLAPDLLLRAALDGNLGIDNFVNVVVAVLPHLDQDRGVQISVTALRRCLRERFRGDEVWTIATLLNTVGDHLDGAHIVRIGLDSALDASLSSRNLVAFDRASNVARMQFIWAIEEIARALASHYTLRIDAPAAEACARLFVDAELHGPRALISASGILLRVAMRSRQEPVSSIVAATFPIVYRELAKPGDILDILKFVPFLDWDRCKTARQELVYAFTSSNVWRPADLALTACRCGDVKKIMGRIGRSYRGDQYLDLIETELPLLEEQCGAKVRQAMYEIRGN